MFYKHKKDKHKVFVVHSNNKHTIIFDYDSDGKTQGGRVLQYNKKDFKKHYTKDKKCKFSEPSKDMINVIMEDYKTNNYAYSNNIDEYIEYKKSLDYKEYWENITEEEYKENLKKFAD